MSALKIKKKEAGGKVAHPHLETLIEDAVSDGGKEELVRINFQVPRSLRTKLKIRAAAEGRSIQDIGIDLLKEYLKKGT